MLELFQFESSCLDFGIYRILNHKHDDIDRFIEEEFLDAVSAPEIKGRLLKKHPNSTVGRTGGHGSQGAKGRL